MSSCRLVCCSLKKKILFVYLAALSLSSAQGSSLWCVGIFVAAHGFFSSHCRPRAPGHVGLPFVTHRLSCSVACGILFPQPGIEPVPLQSKGGVLTTRLPEKSLILVVSDERSIVSLIIAFLKVKMSNFPVACL